MSESNAARRLLGFHPTDPTGRRAGGGGAGPALRGRDPAGGAFLAPAAEPRPATRLRFDGYLPVGARQLLRPRGRRRLRPGGAAAAHPAAGRHGAQQGGRAGAPPSAATARRATGRGPRPPGRGRSPARTRPPADWRRAASCSRSSASGCPRRSGGSPISAPGVTTGRPWPPRSAARPRAVASNWPGPSCASRRISGSTASWIDRADRSPRPGPAADRDRRPAMKQAER